MDLKNFTVLSLTLVVFACYVLAHVDESEPPSESVGGLCSNFQHLRDLIDQEKLERLIQLHYKCNQKFRKAMNFFNTSSFDAAIESLTKTEAYQTVLKELCAVGVNTTDIERVGDIFHCIVLPVQPTNVECNCTEVRHHSFIKDLLDLMPQDEVHQYIASAQANCTNFGTFTHKACSKEFQATLKANIKKRDMAKPLRTLRRKGWDIAELLRAALTIFNY
ncbi:hypothetical protein KR018_004219 [Drosophila ironensis]|nr:hypothetical protein KR018_004219 [Drosophila ironensis]